MGCTIDYQLGNLAGIECQYTKDSRQHKYNFAFHTSDFFDLTAKYIVAGKYYSTNVESDM